MKPEKTFTQALNDLQEEARKFREALDLVTMKINEVEQTLKDAKLFIPCEILIDADETRNVYFSWENSFNKNKFSLFLIVRSGDTEISKKVFRETSLKVRSYYYHFLPIFMDEYTKRIKIEINKNG